MNIEQLIKGNDRERERALTNDRVLFANLHLCCSHVANFDLSVCAINEDVVALDIAVDDWRVVRVKIDETLQDLSAPSFYNLEIWSLQFADISRELDSTTQ